MNDEMTEEERRLTRLVADQGAQIARLTQTLAVRELIIKELRYEVSEDRAAVVAALRRASNHGPMGLSLVNLDSMADAIERGEHRREEEG